MARPRLTPTASRVEADLDVGGFVPYGAAAVSTIREALADVLSALDLVRTIREMRPASSTEEALTAPLHAEALYNLTMLAVANQLRPPQLLTRAEAWTAVIAEPEVLAKFSAADAAAVGAAYTHLANVKDLLARPPLMLAFARARGADVQILEGARSLFAVAEAALRRTTYDTDVQTQLAEAIESAGLLRPLSSKGTWNGVRDGIESVASDWRSLALVAAVLIPTSSTGERVTRDLWPPAAP